jgi:hypothetical protein
MTHRPTEYQAAKRILMNQRDDGKIHGNVVMGMIQDACNDAYYDLDVVERRYINQSCKKLMEIKGIGDGGALELLAAVGDALNNNGRVK